MFLLLLMSFGAASVKAQVRIGGNTPPNPAAALDLNADDSATPAGNKGALALPRVSLASTTAQLNGAAPINGMLVYNTGGTLAAGIYYWNGGSWIALMPQFSQDGSRFVTWTLILDTTIAVPANTTPGYLTFANGRLTANEFCINSHGYVVTTIPQTLQVSFFVSSAGPFTTRFRCYRPSL